MKDNSDKCFIRNCFFLKRIIEAIFSKEKLDILNLIRIFLNLLINKAQIYYIYLCQDWQCQCSIAESVSVSEFTL